MYKILTLNSSLFIKEHVLQLLCFSETIQFTNHNIYGNTYEVDKKYGNINLFTK